MYRYLCVITNGDLGLNEEARQFGVPKITLKRHESGKTIHAAEEKKVVGSFGDIPQDTKREIVKHVMKLEQCLFGATPNELRTLAFSVAERTHISHIFSSK
jgi:hypothetical protein